MRIIAGEFRGRKLLPPDTDATRPITDRVKQSMFDIIAPLMQDAVVYDCFAGTGSMGLESLSRGAKTVTFFEMDRSAIKRLTSNIASLGVERQSKVIAGDVFKRAAESRPAEKASLIFFDPPYRMLRDNQSKLCALAQEFARHHTAAGGTLVFRHDASDLLALPPFFAQETRSYGGMMLEFMRLPVETVLP